RLRVQRASCVRENVWNLVVTKLHFEFAILSESTQMALIVIEAALRLVSRVASSAEHAIETNVGAANQEVLANIAVFVQLGCGQIRLEWKVGTAINTTPEGSETEFNRAAFCFG